MRRVANVRSVVATASATIARMQVARTELSNREIRLRMTPRRARGSDAIVAVTTARATVARTSKRADKRADRRANRRANRIHGRITERVDETKDVRRNTALVRRAVQNTRSPSKSRIVYAQH